MRSALREALTECLARLEAGADIEECLRGQGALAPELRPLVAAAAALREEKARIPEYAPRAFQTGRARMHAARTRQAERAGGVSWMGLLGRPAAVVAVAAAVAVLAALGFTTDLFRFGAESTSAHVEGVVSRVDPDAIVLTTADGQVVIEIGEQTVVLDALGSPITEDDIVPGRPARAEVEEDEDGALAGLLIEIEDDEDDDGAAAVEVEFDGVVENVSGDTITVRAPFGEATVRIGAETEVRGTLSEGAAVEVRATREPDGSYLARKIKAEEAEDGDDDGHHADDGDGADTADDGSDNSGHGSSESESSDSSGHDTSDSGGSDSDSGPDDSVESD